MLPHKQYKVISEAGRITLCNKRFLWHITPQPNINPIPSAIVTVTTDPGIISNSTGNVQIEHTTIQQEGETLPSASTDLSTNPSGYPWKLHETATSNLQPSRTHQWKIAYPRYYVISQFQ